MPHTKEAHSSFIQILNRAQPISEGLHQFILDNFECKVIAKNKTVSKFGDTDNNLWFIASGSLRVFFPCETSDDIDKEHTTRLICEGSFVVSSVGFFNRRKTLDCVETLEKCTLLKLSRENWDKMHQQFPEINYHSRIILEQYNAQISMREYMIRKDSAEERFKVFIEEYSHLHSRFPERHLASFCGMGRSTFSALKNKKYKWGGG